MAKIRSKLIKIVLAIIILLFIPVFISTINFRSKLFRDLYNLNFVEYEVNNTVEISKADVLKSIYKSKISLISPINNEQKTQIDKNTSAEIMLAFNPNNSHIYYSQNIETKVPIASLTKIMTAIIIYENYDADQTITLVKDTPVFTNANNLYMKKNDQVSVENALKLILIASYNDVTTIFSSEFDSREGNKEGSFIEAMNSKAKILGMDNTNFSNTNGYYNDNNYSTASDLQRLVSYFLNNNYLKQIVSLSSASVNYISYNNGKNTPKSLTIYSTNKLLAEDQNVKGIKTGYTKGAGECFIGFYDYVGLENDFVAIILDSDSRFIDSEKLSSFFE